MAIGATPGKLNDDFMGPGAGAVNIIAAGKPLVEADNPRAVFIFKSADDAAKILAAKDAFILAEAFVRGLVDIEGDIYAALSIKDRFYPENLNIFDKTRIILNALRTRRRHTLSNDRAYISHHYEYPDDFYRLFLGPTMAYSCAYFAASGDSLDTAQERKIDYLLAKARLEKGEKLLDIGCGWGSLVIKAARDWGADARGLTLSRTQQAYANRRIRALGLQGRCRVDLLDYRDLAETEKYDKIVSVGMYEHVGSRNLDAYFKKTHDLLRPDGLFINHGITRQGEPDWKKVPEARFIDKYIFPGGELHSASRVIRGMESAGFEVFDVESLRKHYARTLRQWVAALEARKAEALALVPESVYRAWLLYMAGCALTFEEGYLNIHQVSGSKTGRFGGAGIADTRAHLYR